MHLCFMGLFLLPIPDETASSDDDSASSPEISPPRASIELMSSQSGKYVILMRCLSIPHLGIFFSLNYIS